MPDIALTMIAYFALAGLGGIVAFFLLRNRGKTEEVEMPFEEGNLLLTQKKATLVRIIPETKKLVLRIKKEAPEVLKKEEVPREKVPPKVEYEIVREKDERNVIVKKGTVSHKKEFLVVGRRRFFLNHIIKETLKNGKERYFIRWNLYYQEAYDSSGNIEYDDAVENTDSNDMVSQAGLAITALSGLLSDLMRDRSIQLIIVMAFIFGMPIGFSYNSIFHWVPNTVIHWVTRA